MRIMAFCGGRTWSGREVDQGVVDGCDEGEHGGFELALVDGLARIEPVAVVVALEAAEEL